MPTRTVLACAPVMRVTPRRCGDCSGQWAGRGRQGLRQGPQTASKTLRSSSRASTAWRASPSGRWGRPGAGDASGGVCGGLRVSGQPRPKSRTLMGRCAVMVLVHGVREAGGPARCPAWRRRGGRAGFRMDAGPSGDGVSAAAPPSGNSARERRRSRKMRLVRRAPGCRPGSYRQHRRVGPCWPVLARVGPWRPAAVGLFRSCMLRCPASLPDGIADQGRASRSAATDMRPWKLAAAPARHWLPVPAEGRDRGHCRTGGRGCGGFGAKAPQVAPISPTRAGLRKPGVKRRMLVRDCVGASPEGGA